MITPTLRRTLRLISLASNVAVALAAAPVERSLSRGTLVAPDGQTAIASVFRQWDPPSGTGTVNEAAITPDGRLFARAGNLTRRADGTLAAEGSCTAFDGTTYNYSATIRRTPQGLIESGWMTGADDETLTYEATSTSARGGRTTRTMVITHPDGSRETLRAELGPGRHGTRRAS